MLLTEKVKAKWNGRNKAHYTALGYKFSKMGDVFTVKVNELPSGSDVKVKVKCDYCGNDFSPTWKTLLNGRKNTEKDACGNRTCRRMKANEIRARYYTTVADVPNLLNEWCKSNEKKPNEVTAGSAYRAKWKCSKCSREWSAMVYSRTHGNGCPSCKSSKGEKHIAQLLEEMNVDFAREYEFVTDKLVGEGGGYLRYDFAIFLNETLVALIEVDGQQHNYSVEHFGGDDVFNRLKRHDGLKDSFAELNDLALLRLQYYEKGKFEEGYEQKLKEFVDEVVWFERKIQALV